MDGRAERHGQSQSVGRHRCHRRIRAGRRCAGARCDSGSEGGFSGLGSRLDPGALERPRSRRHGNSRPQGRARDDCFRARRARRCRRASAKRCAPARSSSSSPARRCGYSGERLPSVRPGVDVEVTREPVGVVGLITPWNFPIAIPAWKIAPALAYGNCVVFKPADLVPGCAWALAEILGACRRAGRRVQPRDGARSVVGEALVDASGRCRDQLHRIGGDGSRASRRRRSRRLAKVQLEMGGKNPLVVLDDADLDAPSMRRSGRVLSRRASAAPHRHASS